MTVKIRNDMFLHIPKTAGVSISRWLIENAGGKYIEHSKPELAKHMEYRSIKEKFDPDFVFSVVRNPWDRLVSGFHYYKKKGSPKYDISFDDFILTDRLGKLGRNQVHYLQDEKGYIGVDLILRFENLQEDFKQIQERYNSYERLGKKNVSVHTSYQDYYTDQTRDIVAKIYKADIETFNYSYD